jgi:hypothetical protein
MLSLFGIGSLLAVIGLILLGMQTKTVIPSILTVEFPGAKQSAEPDTYNVTISREAGYIPIRIDTGTSEYLSSSITFTMDEDAKTILEPVPDMRKAGYINIKIKADAPSDTEGLLTIRCGAFSKTYILTTSIVS